MGQILFSSEFSCLRTREGKPVRSRSKQRHTNAAQALERQESLDKKRRVEDVQIWWRVIDLRCFGMRRAKRRAEYRKRENTVRVKRVDGKLDLCRRKSLILERHLSALFDRRLFCWPFALTRLVATALLDFRE